MLYHLFEWFRAEEIRFPGSELFRFITFRVLLAVILSLILSTIFGKKLSISYYVSKLVKQ